MGLFSKKEMPSVGDIVEFEVGYTDSSGKHHTETDQGKVKDTFPRQGLALVDGKFHGGTYRPDELTIVKKARR